MTTSLTWTYLEKELDNKIDLFAKPKDPKIKWNVTLKDNF